MYTLDQIQTEFKNVVEQAGCTLTTPILINGRLTRTLGRVVYNYNTPTKVEFSRQFLDTSNDESIHQVILHEAAHYIAVKRSGQRHGHDEYFKRICAEIGCSNDKTTSHVERIVSPEKVFKYAIYCPNCGFIAGRHKWCSVLDNLEYCVCNKCGSEELSYVVNS